MPSDRAIIAEIAGRWRSRMENRLGCALICLMVANSLILIMVRRRGEEDCIFLHERARPKFAQVSLPKWAVPIVGVSGVLSLLCAIMALSREEASVRARLRFQEKVPPH